MPSLLIVLKSSCSPVRSQTIHNGNQMAYLIVDIFMEYSSWKKIGKTFPATLGSKPMSAIYSPCPLKELLTQSFFKTTNSQVFN